MRILPICAVLLVSLFRASAAEVAASVQFAGISRDIIPCATAHYSFGTAVTTNGLGWPMLHVGTVKESPAPGFSEQPEAFRFYFAWTETHPSRQHKNLL